MMSPMRRGRMLLAASEVMRTRAQTRKWARMERLPRGIIWVQRTQRREWLAKVKPMTPRIHAGWTKRRARIWLKEIPRKVYQRKKALMIRPGMVLKRFRCLVDVAVVVMRGLCVAGAGSGKGEGRRPQADSTGRTTCSFDCIVWVWR